jgi:hypothetical protein
LTNDSVSRFHANLVRTPLGVWVIDLLTREGTYVNGERVRWAWLADGDTVRIGSFTFILRYETPPTQISRQDVPLLAGASPGVHPGTQLAVRAQHPDNDGGALPVRYVDRSQGVLKAVNSSPTMTPAPLGPSHRAPWELSIPNPQVTMAMWRQQMHLMESFHNDMIMMVQMFFAMHREHLASARGELDRVEQLTRELSTLQAKLLEPPGSPDAGFTDGVARTGREGPPPEPLNHKKRHKAVASDDRNPASRRQEPNSPRPAGVPRQARSQSVTANGAAPAGSDGASAVDDVQIHALLTKRITELQRERQGYWQKIITKMNK